MRGTNPKIQYFLVSILSVCLVAAVTYPFVDVIGYRSVALLLLFTVSILALRMGLYPVLAAATASALVWNFFFIPPRFTFHIGSVEDGLLFAMYFIVALLNGVLTARIRRIEQEAKQKEERANAARLYDTLFNSLSHELRTPIASLLGASDNLLTNPRLSEEAKLRLYAEIGSSSERLNRLVDNLLNMSRLESGTLQPKKDWCDLNELVFTAINRLQKELTGRPVHVNVPPDLPLVRLDFGLLEQAIFNLLYNAAVYTPENSAVEVCADYVDHQCIISIADHGPGFPTEDLARVFEKFYRLKGSKPGGTGLGLSIVKGFVDAHGGSIQVENRTGGGAKFTLWIPVESKEIGRMEIE